MNKSHQAWSQSFLDSAAATFRRPQILQVSGLLGSAVARWVVERQSKTQKPLLVVVKDFNTAEKLFKELQFFCPAEPNQLFLEQETLVYENQSPEPQTIAKRLQTLTALLTGRVQVVVTSIQAALGKLPPPSWLKNLPYPLHTDQNYPRSVLLETLLVLGYARTEQVEEHGEFAVRGEVADIFPTHCKNPVRLRFQDDQLISIRNLDPVSQQSKAALTYLELWPTHELCLDAAGFSRAEQQLSATQGFNLQKVQQLKETFNQQTAFAGIERFSPWFFENTASLNEYFPETPELIYVEQPSVKAQAESYLEEVLLEFEHLNQPAPAIKDLLLSLETLGSLFPSTVNLCQNDEETIWQLPVHTNRYLFAEENLQPGISKPKAAVNQLLVWHKQVAAVFLVAEKLSVAERLQSMLEDLGTEAIVYPQSDTVLQHLLRFEKLKSLPIIIGSLEQGFRLVDEQGNTRFVLATAAEIFGKPAPTKRVTKQLLTNLQSATADWKIGDYVVHTDYGIARYEGLSQVEDKPSNKGQPQILATDFVTLSYAGGDKIYLPVTRLDQIQKFASQEGAQPTLSKLGSTKWKTAKARVQRRVEEITEELLAVHAKRQAQPGVEFPANEPLLTEFVLAFPYTETEDQQSAAEQVSQDLAQPKPMDRLICGDVGVGKTEIAMRAAFQVVLGGYQVVILAPTTLLVNQHYQSFKRRFKEFSTRIAKLSRLNSAHEAKEVVSGLKSGKIDVVIGTHRLLSKDVQLKSLGLLIIDEEQRFGVRHKEKLKSFRASVDILALSATPIPRTLNLSMMGVRDISLISTFPPDRRSIRTKLAELDSELVVTAVNRELRRGGQVYFVHNRVKNIHLIAQKLQQWMPELRIKVAHGQMPLLELEQVMQDFVDGNFDLLVSTSIIESGLDLPNVNTILVNQSHYFGLAQLYQLRGRVGRSYRQSYAYFLLPKDKVLSPLVNKRLSVLQEMKGGNSGFKIASHDMEIRGVGDILGTEQSGHLATVGLDMYLSMVEQAAHKLKSSVEPHTLNPTKTQLQLPFKVGLPESYISSTNQRLAAYRSIAGCETLAEVFEVRADLEDRFGKLPEVAASFLESMQAKLLAQSLGVNQIKFEQQGLRLSFAESFKPTVHSLMEYLKQQNGRLLPEEQLLLPTKINNSQQLLTFLEQFQQFFKN